MFIRCSSLLFTRIKLASSVRVSILCKCSIFQVVGPLTSTSNQSRRISIFGWKWSSSREALKESSEAPISKEKPVKKAIRYIFLTPEQGKIVLEKLDEVAESDNVIPPDAISLLKESLAAVLEEYERLKTERKLKPTLSGSDSPKPSEVWKEPYKNLTARLEEYKRLKARGKL